MEVPGYLFNANVILSSTLSSGRQSAEGGEPLISIGVTTYDRPQMLRQCVASILGQSYSNIEIIIGNDCVEDLVTFDSLGVDNDPRIRIVNHPYNIGAYNNNYYLLRVATGDLFTWLADDDLMHPDFLGIAYAALSQSKVKSLFVNYVSGPDPDGIFPGKVGSTATRILSGPEFISEYTSRRIKTVGNYGVFRREVFEEFAEVERFGTGLPVYGDTFMPILAATKGDVAYVDLDLIFLRTHAHSRSASLDCIENYASAQKDFLAEFERRCRKYMAAPEYECHLVNLLKWFAGDGWHVIGRRYPGVHQRLSNFMRYILDTIVPRVPAHSRAAFWGFATKMALGDSLRFMASRFLRA